MYAVCLNCVCHVLFFKNIYQHPCKTYEMDNGLMLGQMDKPWTRLTPRFPVQLEFTEEPSWNVVQLGYNYVCRQINPAMMRRGFWLGVPIYRCRIRRLFFISAVNNVDIHCFFVQTSTLMHVFMHRAKAKRR